MPYPHAHYVLMAIVPLIGLAFWPSYFSRLGDSSLAQHVHGATGLAWFLWLVLQSWAIHNRRVELHRRAGKSSVVLFVLFMVGGLLVLHSMALGVAAGQNPFMVVHGPGLGVLDLLALTTFAGLYCGALRHRRSVQLHARYMLATPLLLLAPIFARLFQAHVPGLAITGPETMHLFVYSLYLANALALVAALVLYATAPRHGRPFLVVAAVVVLQSAAYHWLGTAPWWRATYAWFGSLPTVVPVALGLLAGVAIIRFGLATPRPKGGRRPHPQPAA
jgi:hypothetical protein